LELGQLRLRLKGATARFLITFCPKGLENRWAP